MRQPTDLGINRTGIGIAPSAGEQMLEGAEESMPSSAGDGRELAKMRQNYALDAPPVGSVPPPTTVKGIAKAGLEMMKGRKPTVFLNKLGERLAFERTGTRLYEAVLIKFDTQPVWQGGPTRDELLRFQQEELSHFEIVKDAIEFLGGDPTVMTPAADMAAVTSDGVMKVITDPRSSLSESLQALLVAELTDNDGWQMLIQLAQGLGHDKLVSSSQQALAEEDEHLMSVRRWLSAEVEQDAHRVPKTSTH